MQLSTLDWWVLALYGVTILSVGLAFARRAGGGREDYFLAGRSMPWWLIGTSMVATTFSADTPNLVTDLVRSGVCQPELGLVGLLSLPACARCSSTPSSGGVRGC